MALPYMRALSELRISALPCSIALSEQRISALPSSRAILAFEIIFRNLNYGVWFCTKMKEGGVHDYNKGIDF